MSEDWKLLIEAINNLKQESSYLKDYVWPIVSGIFSALLGAGVAFWTIKHQERMQVEKDKLDSGNLLIMLVLQAQSSLIAWKHNYALAIQEVDDPIQRLLYIPRMISNGNSIEYKVESIIFAAKQVPGTMKDSSWRNIVRIFSMIENYNELQTIMAKRSMLHERIVQLITESQSESNIELETLLKIIPNQTLKEAIDLTEKMIVFVDDLIIEMVSFLDAFPKIMQESILTKKIKNYGSVIMTSSPPNQFIHLYDRSVEVDYKKLATIFQESEEVVSTLYKAGQMTSEK
ncbi:hypothetical protein CYQ88_09790 [Hydrogenovibrio sp. SC-1]|uniref:hypothetical protein n=1 Tax=Hydrogenovibrio sp. SC-1 TaxID=2065820 RepID=UPI000C7C293D|nr:hypothetical protein [Hydrogenovibrio sp. SC-1]PLA73739.1 hypothetical protein CYQ88_09790 [Hydrogenovibrio sp. SC-1]